MTAKRALLMAGGTGGHVFPALATARSLQQQGIEVHWMGTAKGIEASVVPEAAIPLHLINIQGLRGKGRLGWLLAPWRLSKALLQALAVMRKVRPQVVLGMGGFASGPGAVAAKLLGIPLVIHEQNAIAGLTNKLSARFATRVLEAFSGAFPAQVATETTGNPVRGPILQLSPPVRRFAERTGPVRLLVLGGSLGARAINQLVPKAVQQLDAGIRPQIWHQSGRQHLDATRALYEAAEVEARIEPFINHMDEAYGWADLVICRAGALTVSELAIAGVPAMLVPYPYAVDDHQSANAAFLEQAGAAWVVQQEALTEQQLARWLSDNSVRQALAARAEKAHQVARPDASERVAAICMEVMQ